MALQMEAMSISVLPGWCLCITCYKRFTSEYDHPNENDSSSTSSSTESASDIRLLVSQESSDISSDHTKEAAKRKLNESFVLSRFHQSDHHTVNQNVNASQRPEKR